jgi:deoxyhypusine synthase
MASDRPLDAAAAVLLPSQPLPDNAVTVVGPSFEHPLLLSEFLKSYSRIGFQATSFGQAVDIVNQMVMHALCHY